MTTDSIFATDEPITIRQTNAFLDLFLAQLLDMPHTYPHAAPRENMLALIALSLGAGIGATAILLGAKQPPAPVAWAVYTGVMLTLGVLNLAIARKFKLENKDSFRLYPTRWRLLYLKDASAYVEVIRTDGEVTLTFHGKGDKRHWFFNQVKTWIMPWWAANRLFEINAVQGDTLVLKDELAAQRALLQAQEETKALLLGIIEEIESQRKHKPCQPPEKAPTPYGRNQKIVWRQWAQYRDCLNQKGQGITWQQLTDMINGLHDAEAFTTQTVEMQCRKCN